MFFWDSGPFDVLAELRGYFNPALCKEKTFRKAIANLLECPYCMGIWIAFFLAFTLTPKTTAEFVVFWFAIAGLQSIITKGFGRNQ